MLNEVNCVLSLSSFARLRDTSDSYLVHIDNEKLIISSQPSSEENSAWEKWQLTGNPMEEFLRRKKHLQDLREGKVQPRKDEQIFTLLPNIGIRDNSLNAQSKLRRFIQQETEFLRNIVKW